MSAKLDRLSRELKDHFGSRIGEVTVSLGELTIEVIAADYLAVALELRDNSAFKF